MLCEILKDWPQCRDLWSSSTLQDFFSSTDSAKYVTKEVRLLIARALKEEDHYNPDDWKRHRGKFWSDEEIQETLSY